MNFFDLNADMSMMMDFYSSAASAASFDDGTTAWFDLSFRRLPELGGFCITAGLEQAAAMLEELRFTDSDIDWLRAHGCPAAFADKLRGFRFSCDIWAVPEGTPVFAGEPIVKVHGPVFQAQLIETLLLQTINFQTMIATKANRIVRASQGRRVIEFGARRAHGAAAATQGARAAYIGGCCATSCAESALLYDIPYFGFVTHNFIQQFPSEYEAFCACAASFADNFVLPIDTYNTLSSGLPNAIRVFNEVLLPRGLRPKGVRIDSGDLAYLSKKVRRALNDAGFPDCDIIASNALDEHIIREMIQHGARVDAFMVGEKLITSAGASAFPGVYKLTATEKNGVTTPVIKLSENVEKITPPGPKLLWRLFDMETGKAEADLITTQDEDISACASYRLFDPDYTWKTKNAENFVARQLLAPVFQNGKRVMSFPSLKDVRAYCANQVDSLWEEVLRFEYPHNYYVDLSQKLWDIRHDLIASMRRGQ